MPGRRKQPEIVPARNFTWRGRHNTTDSSSAAPNDTCRETVEMSPV